MTDEADEADEEWAEHSAAVLRAALKLPFYRPDEPMMSRLSLAIGFIREELRVREPGEGDVATAYAVVSLLVDPTPAMLAAPGADADVWRAMIQAALEDHPR